VCGRVESYRARLFNVKAPRLPRPVRRLVAKSVSDRRRTRTTATVAPIADRSADRREAMQETFCSRVYEGEARAMAYPASRLISWTRLALTLVLGLLAPACQSTMSVEETSQAPAGR